MFSLWLHVQLSFQIKCFEKFLKDESPIGRCFQEQEVRNKIIFFIWEAERFKRFVQGQDTSNFYHHKKWKTVEVS